MPAFALQSHENTIRWQIGLSLKEYQRTTLTKHNYYKSEVFYESTTAQETGARKKEKRTS